MDGKGVDAPGAHIDWRALMRFKRTFTEPVPADRERTFADGSQKLASYVGPLTVEVANRKGLAGAMVVGDEWSDFLPDSKDLISDWRAPMSCGNFNTATGKCGGKGT